MIRLRIFILSFLLLASPILLTAKPIKYYCTMQYNAVACNIAINIGEEVVIPKDKDGKNLVFKTVVSAINYMSRNGWELVPVTMNGMGANSQQWMFVKVIDDKDDVKTLFVSTR